MSYVETRARQYADNSRRIQDNERKVAFEAYRDGFYDAVMQIESAAIYSSKSVLDYIKEIKR